MHPMITAENDWRDSQAASSVNAATIATFSSFHFCFCSVIR